MSGVGAETWYWNDELGFVVHGTMADPRWLDPAVDPNDRRPNWSYQGDPRVVNMSPTGLARFTTLRSWLSQWSYDDARGDALTAAADISVPVLVIGNSADDACTPSHTRRLFAAIAKDRTVPDTIRARSVQIARSLGVDASSALDSLAQ